MKVSTRTRYGIRAAIELAQQYEEGPLQLRVIGQRQDISAKYLEQLMAILKASGLVRSIRGAKGGYMLMRAPDQIRMDEVFHCLEGPVATVQCVADEASCKRAADCVARGLWTEVEQAVNGVLASMTLKDLADKARCEVRQEYEI
jgi:Rrf2 family transcriptional regulator, cysteine metabolism repressor